MAEINPHTCPEYDILSTRQINDHLDEYVTRGPKRRYTFLRCGVFGFTNNVVGEISNASAIPRPLQPRFI